MQATRQDLKREIKQEVLNELQGSHPMVNSAAYRPNMPMGFSGSYSPQFNRSDLELIKQQVLWELQEELNEHPNPWAYRSSQSNPYSSPPYPNSSPYNRTIVESVRNEVLSEIQARQQNRMAEMYGYGNVLSDQKLNRMIDQRYDTLNATRDDIKRELKAIMNLENRRSQDPNVRAIADSIAMEARGQGIPLNEVIQRMSNRPATGTGWRGWLSNMMSGQSRGFLYGLGGAALVWLLWPSARRNFHSVAVRSMEEGMSIVDRARSFVHREPELEDESEHDEGPETDLLQ